MCSLFFDLQANQDHVSCLNHVTNLNLLSLGFQGNGMDSCVKKGLQHPQPAGTSKWCEDMIVIIIALLNLY